MLELPGSVLQQTSQLTHLTLSGSSMVINSASLQHVSTLQNLQELRITHSKVTLSRSFSPGLLRLRNLTDLFLHSVELNPVVLDNCTQLRKLQLHDVKLMQIMGGEQPAIVGGTLLLWLLARLHHLEHLQLCDITEGWPAAPAWAPARRYNRQQSDYSLLTWSPKLQTLEVLRCGLPAGVWPYVFSGIKPSLQRCILHWRDGDWCASDGESGPLPTPAARMDSHGLFQLEYCCTNLRTLHMYVAPNQSLHYLSSLKHLEELTVDGVGATSCSSLSRLSCLSALKHIEMVITSPMAYSNLLELAALTQLTCLRPDVNPGLQFKDYYDVDSVFETPVSTARAAHASVTLSACPA